jgi:hypothetical protein
MFPTWQQGSLQEVLAHFVVNKALHSTAEAGRLEIMHLLPVGMCICRAAGPLHACIPAGQPPFLATDLYLCLLTSSMQGEQNTRTLTLLIA